MFALEFDLPVILYIRAPRCFHGCAYKRATIGGCVPLENICFDLTGVILNDCEKICGVRTPNHGGLDN